jgi:hypothetical protein
MIGNSSVSKAEEQKKNNQDNEEAKILPATKVHRNPEEEQEEEEDDEHDLYDTNSRYWNNATNDAVDLTSKISEAISSTKMSVYFVRLGHELTECIGANPPPR